VLNGVSCLFHLLFYAKLCHQVEENVSRTQMYLSDNTNNADLLSCHFIAVLIRTLHLLRVLFMLCVTIYIYIYLCIQYACGIPAVFLSIF
jgi:hypothetical protein